MSRKVSKIEYKQNGASVDDRVFDEPVTMAKAQSYAESDKKYLHISAPPHWSQAQKKVTETFTYVDVASEDSQSPNELRSENGALPTDKGVVRRSGRYPWGNGNNYPTR
jgi:hypothetical protein